MKRLETVLPEWTRVQWTSATARREWEPRISGVTGMWHRLERWTVVDGLRKSCLTFEASDYLPELTRWAQSHGCVAIPQSIVGARDIYSASPQTPGVGEPWQYRVIFTQAEYADEWHAIFAGEVTDHKALGRLLGFPDCCIDFFQRVWIDEQWKDTTWPMAENTAPDANTRIEIGTESPVECNILLRWLGPRLVPHLPCSFDCQATVEFAKGFREVGRARQFDPQLDDAREMLSWPVEWDALHGIAEIRTPILRISSRTDTTAKRYVVRRHGTSYPNEGATGLRFPFEHEEPFFATAKKLDAILDEANREEPVDDEVVRELSWSARDNGFMSDEAMTAAHDIVLQAAGRLPVHAMPVSPIVADAGCGDGLLLERFINEHPMVDWWPVGIEHDSHRAESARQRLVVARDGWGTVVQGDICERRIWAEALRATQHIDVLFLMPGRILERPDQADTLREVVGQAAHVVVYAYGDNLEAHDGSLENLCRAAGLSTDDRQPLLYALYEQPTAAAAILHQSKVAPAPGPMPY